MNKLKQIPEALALLISMGLSLLFFTLTNPRHVPPGVFIFGFGLLFTDVLLLIRLIGRALGLPSRFSIGRLRVAELCLTALLVLLVALQSIGQLTVRDTITICILCGAGYFYASRASRRT